ncbi:DUF659 domain-containing protein [Mycena indigotica]|uniref:DUF659 domain-containing protein n=1 Tax=Mycena indigotica TaxID=2126181 RepID=A0A8H6T4M2_9AGAR|nr:DUF659 domain-containing protein [Mycena indigotica]KAF7310297.1 DUF659 domain-containing protein [Mycena indigotica]
MPSASKTSGANGIQLTGYLYYNNEIENLKHLLNHLPNTIPVGTAHNFIDYVPDPEVVNDLGSEKSALNRDLEVSFGFRANNTVITFKSRGPHLEAVATVIRQNISGSGGDNILLVKWVDDLTCAAKAAFANANVPLPRKGAGTARKRAMQDELAEKEATKHQKTAENREKARRDATADRVKAVTQQGSVHWDFNDLRDIELPERSKKGAPTNSILDTFLIPCETISTGKRRDRCVGTGCKESWSYPRKSDRVYEHAANHCHGISDELQAEAKRNLKQGALSTVIAAATGTAAGGVGKKNFFAAFEEAGKADKKKADQLRRRENNLACLNWVCDAGLSLRSIDRPSARLFFTRLAPNHGIYSASTMASYIQREAARITADNIESLRVVSNLTISTDGGTMAGQQVYNIHITNPISRESYLIRGDEASGVSHTGKHIRDVLLKVMSQIGVENFAAVVSDNAGNVRVARELIQQDHPAILSLFDPPHHLSNLIKDICRIEHFKPVIERMRLLITFFSQSTYAATHLSALRVVLYINKGLEKIGKTRFGTMYYTAYSLIRCFEAIRMLFHLDIIHTTGSEELSKLAWMRSLPEILTFEMHLKQLISVLEPIARAIKCLESSHTTVGDVWKFYVAITAVLKTVFEENVVGIPVSVQQEIRGAVNARVEQMLGCNSVYLTGFFLDPDLVQSSILRSGVANQLDNSASSIPQNTGNSDVLSDSDLRAEIPAYVECGQFMLDLLYEEMNSGRYHPVFDRYNDSTEITDAFKSQCERFTRQRAPFNARNPAWTCLLDYYTALMADPDAAIFAFVASKIVSILPTSMPEERTMSFITKINSKDRSRQDAQTTIAMTQVHQDLRRRPEYVPRPTAKAAAKKTGPIMNWRSVDNLFTAENLPATAPTSTPATAPAPIVISDESDNDAAVPEATPMVGSGKNEVGLQLVDADDVVVGLSAVVHG